MRKTHGITLVALIITIVVMLILVAVSVNVTIKSNLIGTAEKTGEKYKTAGDFENIKIAINTYYVERVEDKSLELADVIAKEGWCKEAVYNENSECIKVVTKEERKYTVLPDKTIIEGNFDFFVKDAEELRKAILQSVNDNVIGVKGDISITGNLGDGTEKQIKIMGTSKNTGLNMDNAKANGVFITFENLTIKTAGTIYVGFTSEKAKYVNCIIENEYFTLAKNVDFNKCIFNQTSSNQYNIWTYGSNINFTECTFNSQGKSVLIYNEGGSAKSIVNFKNCTLNAKALAKGKAAIEIDSTYSKFEVNINNCTQNGFDNGSVSGNPLWNQKKGTQATITVNGETV